MHLLKTACPLLASVAYFVLFAIALFSYVPLSLVVSWVPKFIYHRIISIQSFNGSMRWSCYLGETLGKTETPLSPFLWGIYGPTFPQSIYHLEQEKWHCEGLYLSPWPSLQGLCDVSFHGACNIEQLCYV